MSTPARPEKLDPNLWMTRWDDWREYISSGGKGSRPRDAFESLLQQYEELEKYTDWLEKVENH
jgi:hypothetical protein